MLLSAAARVAERGASDTGCGEADGLSYLAKAVVTDALFRQIHGNRSFVATDGLAPLRIVIR